MKPWKTTAALWGPTRNERVTVPLEITIDWNGIAKTCGQKAFDNKSKRSRYLNGLIVVKAGAAK